MAAAPAEVEKLREKPQGEQEDMELVNEEKPEAQEKAETPAGNGSSKRTREEGGEETNAEAEVEETKRQKVDDKSFEEERIEQLEGAEVAEKEEGEEKEKPTAVSVGPKNFSSSVEMFDYFFKFLHTWPPYLDLNKYEQIVLLELLKKGHPDSSKKIGQGIQSFQVRFHPLFKSRCFFIVRADGTTEDFSFRKCVDVILPLPDDMKAPTSNNKAGGRGGGGRGSHGRGGRGGSRR